MTIQDDPFASFKLLGNALQAKGYRSIIQSDDPIVVTYEGPHKKRWTTKAAHISYPFNSELVRSISINKQKAYAFAAEQGFSTPYSKTVEGELSQNDAETLLSKYGKLIVKPANSSLGRGLTLNITTLDQLRDAIQTAREVSSSILVQEQVEGKEIRFMVIGGKVEAALLRQTARVVGDGITTIRDLIAKENEARRAIKFEMITYPELTEELVGDLVFSERVPAKGEIVELNRSTMVRGGASIYNILDEVHPSYIQKVEALVQKLGAGFIVADVFCKEYTLPANNHNYWLIEFNTAPVLKVCYACRDGRQFDIVARLADQIDLFLTGVNA